jgi:hypothetical protein
MEETTVVQVRDVPVSVLATLKARGEAQGISLSAFLRNLMASEAAMPPINDVLATIASREPVNYEAGDLRSFAEDGRRSPVPELNGYEVAIGRAAAPVR